MLKNKKDLENENRLENLKELLRAMHDYDNLQGFLEHVALATSLDQEAALAQGINVGRVFGLVWFIAGLLAAFAGFFITGGFNMLTNTSFISALRALPAVVIGGLDSIPGAVVGSLIIGLTQAYVGYYQLNIEMTYDISFGNGFSIVAPYLIMFVILMIKPHGLFGTEEVERV